MKTHEAVMIDGHKKCSKCTKIKTIYLFSKNGQKSDGHLSHCKACEKIIRDNRIAKMKPIWDLQNSSITKICKTCLEVKPITLFHKALGPSDGREGKCTYCRNYQISKAHQKLLATMTEEEQFNFKRNLRILRKYKISVDAFNKMLTSQNNSCAICQRLFNSGIRSFCIDHDHSCCPGETSCGECVRGILCDKCNWAIGLLGESVWNLNSAINYLTKWEWS